jgi:peptidoglycan/LPS O-acetylase OafA/YrhL
METKNSQIQKQGSEWDWAGVAISALCILHCLAVPIVLIAFPVLGAKLIPDEDMTHAVLLAFILGVAGFAFVSGYRVHGQKKPVIWMLAGVAIITYATFFAHDQVGHFWEPVIAIIGSLALIRAHILNHRCKTCEIHHGESECSLHSHDHEHPA